MLIGTWKKNGLRLRILGEIKGRHGEMRLQVQKTTAEGMHGLFSVRPSEIEGISTNAETSQSAITGHHQSSWEQCAPEKQK